VYDDPVDATCTEKGYSSRRFCLLCREPIDFVEVKALGHTFGTDAKREEPGCEEEGSITGKCTKCEKDVSDPIPKLGGSHDWWERMLAVQTKCEENGYDLLGCYKCTKTQRFQIDPATGHLNSKPANKVAAIRGGSTGYQNLLCQDCGKTFKDETTEHPYNKCKAGVAGYAAGTYLSGLAAAGGFVKTVNSTTLPDPDDCTKDAYSLYICDICGAEHKEALLLTAGAITTAAHRANAKHKLPSFTLPTSGIPDVPGTCIKEAVMFAACQYTGCLAEGNAKGPKDPDNHVDEKPVKEITIIVDGKPRTYYNATYCYACERIADTGTDKP
jgi:DNA-directed RNA polymerase subunit RPC12/RpoP